MSSAAIAPPTITQADLAKIALWEAVLHQLHSSLLTQVAAGGDIEKGNFSLSVPQLERAAKRRAAIRFKEYEDAAGVSNALRRALRAAGARLRAWWAV